MFLGGSRVFEFIKNPHDFDFNKVEDEITDWDLINNYPQSGKCDVFIIMKHYIEEKDSNFLINISKQRLINLTAWDKRINKFSPYICIFNKEDLINYLLNFKLTKGQEKVFYRFEILLEFLENDLDFNPTEQQKELINNLHDCKINLNEYLKEVNIRLDKLKIFL